jgi:hypothetical protein
LIQTDAGKFQEARGKEGLGEKPWVSSSRTGIEWGHTCSDSKKFFIYCLNYRESIVAHVYLTQTYPFIKWIFLLKYVIICYGLVIYTLR